MRRIFIGDIQGCRAQLDMLLQQLALRPGDRVFCVGDIVNRGPDSLGALRRIREIGARSVLGNHDLHLLRLASRSAGDPPPQLEPILRAADAADLLDWLARQPIMLVDDAIVVVHAGIHPKWNDLNATASEINRAVSAYLAGSRNECVAFATEVRYCDVDGQRPAQDDPPPGPPFLPWDHWYRAPQTIVFGHWARRGRVAGARVRGLDTGCVYGGALTAWIAEEDRFVQVPGLSAP
jgi:bis(5'-nucleosyl)-tetraphosphatase (symmetrical)